MLPLRGDLILNTHKKWLPDGGHFCDMIRQIDQVEAWFISSVILNAYKKSHLSMAM